MTSYTFHRHRVCLVDCVDLIHSFVQLVQRFWVFFLSHTAPGFQLWLYFHLCMWVIHWGLLLRLPWRTWVCPCEAQCGGGVAAWLTGVLAASGTQGSWRLEQQEIQCARRVWQPVLANTLQYSCLENSPPQQRSLAGHSPQGRKVSDMIKTTLHV